MLISAALLLLCVARFHHLALSADALVARMHAVPAAGAIAWTVLSVLAVLALRVALYCSIRNPNAMMRTRKRGGSVLSPEAFRSLAGDRGISRRVAAEAYTLLLPYLMGSDHVRLDDGLEARLRLTETQVFDLKCRLLRRTNRAESRELSHAAIVTVVDLLRHVQHARPLYPHGRAQLLPLEMHTGLRSNRQDRLRP